MERNSDRTRGPAALVTCRAASAQPRGLALCDDGSGGGVSGAGASSFLLGAHGGGSPCRPPTRPGRGAGAKPGRGLGPSTLFSRRRPDDLGKPSSTLRPQELGVLRTRLIGVTRKVYKCLLSVPHAGHSHNSVCQLEFNIIFKALRSTRADSRQRGCSRWCGWAGTRLGFGVRRPHPCASSRTPAPSAQS